ncbi:putative D-xylulose 5-phosphate/D-fructose 6-phosphate phosphoketolase [Basidiobolus meristosporus CBS 931.73]|uniref:Putative D-xylulose 5-phosphate/D-fructose 6-phosphate phosphoketolase n=1 Tax=Basidiobolus meristosporus CBS 931.73 TaxID=1314790 RepID=A0A1Y1YAZ0_9FUNG|nr:putative D-xylulose 5-phosphate/D-fructose 6-phosphate phosphoketolase [Basidiobolus meristosporus CBS 931.73]ORX95170.1 putative D-xylulose 5-phosphate/D-fructose 6-phosphate phosphoketolase [Basidiobolus meristosporus CBS 931.73]|eukprot:ORX75350.1 putative D-xylulose 5-phosphate/D-fructose 6-phosphate phosphoketolase [Basidiobolus meristosporus CBS 931.73]
MPSAPTKAYLEPDGELLPPAKNLLVELDLSKFEETRLEAVILQQRAANYLAAAMIFLKENPLLREPLKKEHIKDRLLGHWGTCPGINLVYAHCNFLIKQHDDVNMFLVTGPGHGAPANLANLYLEGALKKFYSQYDHTLEGVTKLVHGFSWPGGFPSHVNSEVPGQIHEGGELGYSLAVSFGAVMDNPDLIVTCIVGDGEAETGPTATAWHSYKYIDPKESGAVLPILHVNGFKISEKTVFGCMDNTELAALFSGYGYQVRIVDGMDNINVNMAVSMEWAYQEIRKIQKAAREGNPITKPRWPILIMRTLKGWSGPVELHGQAIEGSWKSHQVPLPNAAKDDDEFDLLSKWLQSYKPEELFDESGIIRPEVTSAFPESGRQMGSHPLTYAGYKPLDVPDWKQFAIKENTVNSSCTKAAGQFLKAVIQQNERKFRIFSPDELSSNKLDAVLEITNRDFQWAEESRNHGGRVSEVLSEHTCQGWMQGYTLTGRVSLFPSYETFLGIITTMMVQYAKFVKMAKETPWREPIGSLNYIETSTLWRQEHNGFSHQNPGFINSLISLKPSMIRIYLPPDANCLLSTLAHCLRSKEYINLMISGKHETPSWLTPEEADRHCIAGASVWKFASTDDGVDPDVVLVGCGTEVTFEVIAAASMLRKDFPDLRVRVINVTDLMVLAGDGTHPHALSDKIFNSLFTTDKPIVFNFHGYSSVIKQLLYDRADTLGRVVIRGYNEEGTTTTPFRMLTANGVSRYDVAINALRMIAREVNPAKRFLADVHLHISQYQHEIRQHEKYIIEHGTDPEGLTARPEF